MRTPDIIKPDRILIWTCLTVLLAVRIILKRLVSLYLVDCWRKHIQFREKDRKMIWFIYYLSPLQPHTYSFRSAQWAGSRSPLL